MNKFFYFIKSKTRIFCRQSLNVGFFLAVRQIKRTNIWTTIFIIFIMLFTFLNLVVVNGILVGLIEGSRQAYINQYSGEIIIKPAKDRPFIKDSYKINKVLENMEEISAFSFRYITSGQVESDYQRSNKKDQPADAVSAQIVGINLADEESVTNLSKLVVEGSYLRDDNLDEILVGSNLLEKYNLGVSDGATLKNVQIGDRVILFLGEVAQEYKIRGIVKNKISEVSRRIYLSDKVVRKLIGRNDYNVNEIAIRIKDKCCPLDTKNKILKDANINLADVSVETWEESQGQFFNDITRTFNLLGSVIGLISLFVSSITIFIIIFINAINRKKYIGILRGIGICDSSIQLSYLLQSIFYVGVASLVGLLILYLFLTPYFQANPIDFPFSDGILYAPIEETFFRLLILFLVTIIASYIPAKLIVRKDILNSILGK